MRIRRTELAWLTGVLALSGCTVGPKYHTPPAPVPPAYKETPAGSSQDANWKVASPQDAMLRGAWWEIFNDAELNALQQQLDAGNQNIAQAYENYMAARALVREAIAQYFPTVTETAAATRSKSSGNLGGAFSANSGTSSGGRVSNDYSLPGVASWEPDLWGRVRNTVKQFRSAAQVSAADLENTRLSQHSLLAQLFFQLRGQDALQRVLDDTVAADRKSVDYARAQYETGVGNRLSLVEAQTALETAEAIAISIGVARAQFEHAIAVLVGKPPSEFSLPVRPLDAVPPPVPLGMPSQLLERRPDIAAAERLMAEANAQIGLAYTAYYPTLTLTARGGFEASTYSRWFLWPSLFWSIGGSAAQTVFEGGLRHATVEQFKAAYDADVASYRQTVLTAFQQVEDSLSSERILSAETQKQTEAVASAREFLRLELDRYQTGIDPYLAVLTAQTTLLSAEQTLANLRTQRMTSVVQLIAALGGGWDRSELPAP